METVEDTVPLSWCEPRGCLGCSQISSSFLLGPGLVLPPAPLFPMEAWRATHKNRKAQKKINSKNVLHKTVQKPKHPWGKFIWSKLRKKKKRQSTFSHAVTIVTITVSNISWYFLLNYDYPYADHGQAAATVCDKEALNQDSELLVHNFFSVSVKRCFAFEDENVFLFFDTECGKIHTTVKNEKHCCFFSFFFLKMAVI